MTQTKLTVTIATIYLLLLLGTGYLAFVSYPSYATVANAEDIANAKGDEDFKKDLLEDIRMSRERTTRIIDLAAHSFDVILGALLGFLSAVATRFGLVGDRSDNSEPLRAKTPEAPHNTPTA